MRKILTLVFALMVTGSLFAGGLVTNTNQGAPTSDCRAAMPQPTLMLSIITLQV